MTPIQKAKEIYLAAINYLHANDDGNFTWAESFDRWLATPEAAALLSGEDWKEDGWVSVEESLPELIDPTGVESAEMKVRFKDCKEGNAWFHVDHGWCAWGIGKNNLPVTHWKNT